MIPLIVFQKLTLLLYTILFSLIFLHASTFRINQRKKEAMQCYTNSLNKSPPNTHRVQKCLQKLLRSMHKDRSVS